MCPELSVCKSLQWLSEESPYQLNESPMDVLAFTAPLFNGVAALRRKTRTNI